MDNIENTVSQETAAAIDSTGDDWDDIDLSDLTDDGEDGDSETEEIGTEADQQPDQDDADNADSAEGDGEDQEQTDKGADQTFELKHLGEVKTVNRDEVIALAQMGLDYDRVRGKYEELKAADENRSKQDAPFQEFVKELADSAGVSIDELMDQTRAKLIAAKDGISELDALNRVRSAKAARAAEAQRTAEEQKNQAVQREVQRFVDTFPGVKAEDVPKEVWDEADRTGDLVGSYARYRNAQQEARIAALEKEKANLAQDKKNEERSTGSRKSAGQSTMDAIDRDWYDGT